MKDFDFNKHGQKIFIDGLNIRIINGNHYIALQSGEDAQVFVAPLPVSKSLGRALLKQIEEIEKQKGIEIPSQLSNEPTPSPLKFDNESDSDK